MAKKVTNIPVDGDSKGYQVKVKRSVKMADAVDTLMELDDKTYRKVVKITRSYRRINAMACRLFKRESVILELAGPVESTIINNLISLGNKEFRKVVSCTKRYRKASRMLDSAITNYTELRDEDAEVLASKMEAIYA